MACHAAGRGNAGQGWPVSKHQTAPLRAAEHRSASGSNARMFEAMDGRVRAGPPGVRSAGAFRQHDVAETGTRSAVALATFPERKVARSPQASETAQSTSTRGIRAAQPATSPPKVSRRPYGLPAIHKALWIGKICAKKFPFGTDVCRSIHIRSRPCRRRAPVARGARSCNKRVPPGRHPWPDRGTTHKPPLAATRRAAHHGVATALSCARQASAWRSLAMAAVRTPP